MINLTRYDVAYIGIRLLAIYIALQIISSFPSWFVAISLMFNSPSFPYAVTLKLFTILMPLLILLIPVLLWTKSEAITRLLTKTSTNITTNEQADNSDLQATLFCAIGVYLLVTALPELIAWLYTYIRVYLKSTSTMEMLQRSPSVITFIILILRILFCIMLISTAKKLSAFFYKIRYKDSKN